jgi:hypothetical protein
MSKHEPK